MASPDKETCCNGWNKFPGVSKVLFRNAADHKLTFEVESLPGRSARPDVARAVVNSGWSLLEMRSLNYSLEEVFLQLTGAEAPTPEPQAVGGEQ